ncbi:MAG TPA: hypothetical protein VHY08_13945 [Bacillota bacterium]|nr:hypothetical protein [Bacillota bacterium]
MAKNKRGKNIKKIANWRGTCPGCQRTRVKLLWEKIQEGGGNLKVCKQCAK